MKQAQYINANGVRTGSILYSEEDIKLTEIINLSREIEMYKQEIENNKRSARHSNLIAFGAFLVSIASLVISILK